MGRVIIDNRYKILKKLGDGAMGVVYKAKDLKNDTIVALKMLSKKKTTSKAIQHFKREFRLLAGFRHPNLCTVYDFGTLKDGRSYFTMEYIDGSNILEFTKKLPYEKIYPVRKNISNGVYPLIIQLCRALEYIHSKGLIHYDIKPGNVLIAESKGQRAEGNKKQHAQGPSLHAKLLDFGLAGEQQIKGGALIKGTFPYIAPEVIKGLVVDHRADLYSLGVLLYEIFTRKAFQKGKESFVTLLKLMQDRMYEPPSRIVANIPKGLERLIIRLIDVEPASRFSRANEIIKEINKISGKKFAIETEKTLEAYLLSSRFVGRDKEMGLLTSLFEKARQGKGKVVLVTGDAGIGKSRLLKEFKIFTQLRHSHSFVGYAYKDKTGSLEPFHDIFSEIINYIGDGPGLSRSRVLKLSLAVLFKIFPDLTDRHLKKNLPKLVFLEPKQEKLRNFYTLTELIRHIASELGELVILLEDLHWADDLSIQFLEYLGRNLTGRNIFICGTCRKEELKDNLILKRMMVNLRNEDCLSQIELGPLRFRGLYSFLNSTITPGSNSSELVRYLMKKTGGNPFFVEEIMRTLLRTKSVSIGQKMGIEHFKRVLIPETIEEIVLKGIKDLDSNSQKVIKFAAVLLKDFEYDVMRRLTGLDDTELSRALWELKRRQVLIEEDNRYRFYHATLREAISKRMAYRERRKLYYQAGKTSELIYKGNTAGVVEDLAYYFINARNHKKGVSYGLQAAVKSRKRYANEQAIKFYKGVLVLLANKNPKRRFYIFQKLAHIEIIAGYFDDAIKDYNKALSLKTGTIDEKTKIYIPIARVYGIRGEYNKAVHIYQKAGRLLKRMKSSRLKSLLVADTNVKICSTYVAMEDYKRASKFNFDSIKLLKENLKQRKLIKLQAGICNTIGIIEYNKVVYGKADYDYDKAISYYKKACENYKKIKYEYGLSAALNNLGLNYNLNLDFEKSFSCYQKAIKISEKIGDLFGLSIALYNSGRFFSYDKGCYFKALDYFQKVLSISKKIGYPRATGVSYSCIGVCFLMLCNYKMSKEYLEKGLKTFDTIDWKAQKMGELLSLGKVYQAEGDYTSALRIYRRSLKITRDIRRQQDIANIFTYIGLLFIEIGEFFKAKRYFKDALKIVTTIESKEAKIDCYIGLCRINIMTKDYAVARDYYKKGIGIAQKLGWRRQSLQFFLLASEINYYEKNHLKGIKVANKTLKLAKEMGTKDLYVNALLIKAKNGIKHGILSKIEVIKLLDEAKRIAEEIGCPEILWKVYFEYGKRLQEDKEYLKALEYYQKCNGIFRDVGSKINNVAYLKSYLSHPDRKAVFTAIDEIISNDRLV